MSTEAMKLALDALERYQVKRQDFDRFADEIIALREALTSVPDWASEAIEQPAPVAEPRKQEPVAWVRWEWNRSGLKSLVFKKPEELSLAETATGVVYDPLYTSPSTLSLAQRQARSADTWVHATAWRGLTDGEIQAIWRSSEHMNNVEVCRAIEAKLKEKNCD